MAKEGDSSSGCTKSHTHPNEADDHTERHQNEIPNEESNEPDDTKAPRYELMVSIRSCQQIPVFQLFGFESRCYLIFNDWFNTGFDVVKAIGQMKIDWMIRLLKKWDENQIETLALQFTIADTFLVGAYLGVTVFIVTAAWCSNKCEAIGTL